MNEKIKEILDRLKRIDHKEYSCGFEFADSGSFDEDCRCFEERKILADCITNLQEELEKYKRYVNETFLYSYEALQDKVLNLQEENKRLKEDNLLIKSANKLVSDNLHNYKKRCEQTFSDIERTIEIIKQQPSENDTWILDRLSGFEYILQGSNEE